MNSKGLWNRLVSIPWRIKGAYLAHQGQGKFKVTPKIYSGAEDLNIAIRDDLGSDYKLADWNDIKAAYDGDIKSWTYSIGLKKGQDYFVSKNDHPSINGRHYLITRFDHEKTDNYLVHDHLDNYFITLGSYNDIDRQAIAIKST